MCEHQKTMQHSDQKQQEQQQQKPTNSSQHEFGNNYQGGGIGRGNSATERRRRDEKSTFLKSNYKYKRRMNELGYLLQLRRNRGASSSIIKHISINRNDNKIMKKKHSKKNSDQFTFSIILRLFMAMIGCEKRLVAERQVSVRLMAVADIDGAQNYDKLSAASAPTSCPLATATDVAATPSLSSSLPANKSVYDEVNRRWLHFHIQLPPNSNGLWHEGGTTTSSSSSLSSSSMMKTTSFVEAPFQASSKLSSSSLLSSSLSSSSSSLSSLSSSLSLSSSSTWSSPTTSSLSSSSSSSLSSLQPPPSGCVNRRPAKALSLLMTLFMALAFGGGGSSYTAASWIGACWQTALENGKCNEIYSLNITKADCCRISQEFSYTDRELSNAEYFFATAIGGGMECSPCIATCDQVKCAPNKKCVQRNGRPKCICSPECGAAVRRGRQQQQQQQQKHQLDQQQPKRMLRRPPSEWGMVGIVGGSIYPRDTRSLSSEITKNININLNKEQASPTTQHQQQQQSQRRKLIIMQQAPPYAATHAPPSIPPRRLQIISNVRPAPPGTVLISPLQKEDRPMAGRGSKRRKNQDKKQRKRQEQRERRQRQKQRSQLQATFINNNNNNNNDNKNNDNVASNNRMRHIHQNTANRQRIETEVNFSRSNYEKPQHNGGCDDNNNNNNHAKQKHLKESGHLGQPCNNNNNNNNKATKEAETETETEFDAVAIAAANYESNDRGVARRRLITMSANTAEATTTTMPSPATPLNSMSSGSVADNHHHHQHHHHHRQKQQKLHLQPPPLPSASLPPHYDRSPYRGSNSATSSSTTTTTTQATSLAAGITTSASTTFGGLSGADQQPPPLPATPTTMKTTTTTTTTTAATPPNGDVREESRQNHHDGGVAGAKDDVGGGAPEWLATSDLTVEGDSVATTGSSSISNLNAVNSDDAAMPFLPDGIYDKYNLHGFPNQQHAEEQPHNRRHQQHHQRQQQQQKQKQKQQHHQRQQQKKQEEEIPIRTHTHIDKQQEYHHPRPKHHQQQQQQQQHHHTPHPVCGTDGRTYNTECQLKKRACRTDNPNLSVAYRGHCRTSCSGVKCLKGLQCVEDQNTIPHCIICDRHCPEDDDNWLPDKDISIENRNKHHYQHYHSHSDVVVVTHNRTRPMGDTGKDIQVKSHPQQESHKRLGTEAKTEMEKSGAVCGVDGKTYTSICDINRMICKIGRSIAVAYPGSCRADRVTCSDISCGPKQTCLVDLVSHEPRCVSCRYKCSRKRRPTMLGNGKLCGLNNRTYNSWCELRKDSCATGFFIDIKSLGKCQFYL